MHNIFDPINQIDPAIAYSHDLLGKECCTCLKVFPYSFYLKDSSYRDGYKDQCDMCRTSPKMSIVEHTARLKEMNFSSEAVKRQRWGKNQTDWMVPDYVRMGVVRHHSEVINGIRKLLTTEKLFIREGNFLGDFAAYQISGVSRPDFSGPRNDYKYLFYIPTGFMPEFSLMEFNEMAIPVREYKRGWRNVLARLVKAKLLTEDDIHYTFGRPPENIASQPYRRELYQIRNKMLS